MAMPPHKKTAKSVEAKKKPFRRFKASKASSLASALVTPAIRRKGFAQAEVITKWSQIVGHELAVATVPVKLMFPRGEKMGAKLIIRCESAFAPLVVHKSERIIQMVNSFFGYGAVAKVEVKQGPLPKVKRTIPLDKKPLTAKQKEKLDNLVGKKELSPLQEAIKSLGETVLSNKK
ncbi:DUF721 domain-containing protein [Kordiimonas laminariae]|uniref:DUF721 domain-containing protein n=1 Tax=Kordiimonas laminariae TaxID=2917717 RepID=UPI001FF41493|nr:DciA family protein [Kordiimonas laminariae]MCK0068795.1 DciA family protein [Kordiimonas laminariae]